MFIPFTALQYKTPNETTDSVNPQQWNTSELRVEIWSSSFLFCLAGEAKTTNWDWRQKKAARWPGATAAASQGWFVLHCVSNMRRLPLLKSQRSISMCKLLFTHGLYSSLSFLIHINSFQMTSLHDDHILAPVQFLLWCKDDVKSFDHVNCTFQTMFPHR